MMITSRFIQSFPSSFQEEFYSILEADDDGGLQGWMDGWMARLCFPPS